MTENKKTVVKVRNLVKRYGDLKALNHLDLEVKDGEIFGLLGPNGSGKTTLINCLLALLKYEQGEVTIFGEDMTPSSYEIKRQIGVVFQDVAVFEQMSVYENIDYFCSLYVANGEERRDCVEEAIRFVGLEDYKKKKPKQLSGGLKRRLNIACGIAHHPRLIIMDEPTVAVDPQSRNNILEGIKELNKRGSTVIYTSHYMEEVDLICTRIVILDHGKCIAEGTSDELKSMLSVAEEIVIEEIAITEDQLAEIRSKKGVIEADCEDSVLRLKMARNGSSLTDILMSLEKGGIEYGRVFTERPTLNDVFLELTGKELRD